MPDAGALLQIRPSAARPEPESRVNMDDDVDLAWPLVTDVLQRRM
jgi:hypothetical protein